MKESKNPSIESQIRKLIKNKNLMNNQNYTISKELEKKILNEFKFGDFYRSLKIDKDRVRTLIFRNKFQRYRFLFIWYMIIIFLLLAFLKEYFYNGIFSSLFFIWFNILTIFTLIAYLKAKNSKYEISIILDKNEYLYNIKKFNPNTKKLCEK